MLSVNFKDPVVKLQTVFTATDRTLIKAGNLRCADFFLNSENTAADNDAENDIKNRTGGGNNHSFPDRFITESALILAVFVLSLHADKAADREKTQRIYGFLALLFENRRAHTERKLVDLDFESLGKKEMTELMNKNNQSEK